MKKLSACLLAFCLAWPWAALAGTQCEIRPATPQKLADATVTAMSVVAALDEADAPVALVARVGTDLSKQGLVYSHIGCAITAMAAGRCCTCSTNAVPHGRPCMRRGW